MKILWREKKKELQGEVFIREEVTVSKVVEDNSQEEKFPLVVFSIYKY